MDWLETEQGKGHIKITKFYAEKFNKALIFLRNSEQVLRKIKNYTLNPSIQKSKVDFEKDMKELKTLLKKSKIQV